MLCTCCLCDAHRFVKSVYIYIHLLGQILLSTDVRKTDTPEIRCAVPHPRWSLNTATNFGWVGEAVGKPPAWGIHDPFAGIPGGRLSFYRSHSFCTKYKYVLTRRSLWGCPIWFVLSKSVKLIFKLQLMGVRRRRVTNNSRKSLCGCVRERGCGVRR